MRHPRTAFLLGLAFVAAAAWLPAGRLTAQPAASTSHFLVGQDAAPGGICTSTGYRLEASFGSGVVAARADSANYRLLGGFNAVIEAPVAGQPWITGVLPCYAPMLGSSAAHVVHGTELHLGPSTNVTIGGVAAPVLSRSSDRLVVNVPVQPAPGWQPVTVTNSGGTAHLTRGLGILPMLEKPHAVEIGQPFRVTYRGNQGDIVFLLVTSARLPAPVPMSPYLHGLELSLAGFLGFVGPLPVVDPSGEFHLDFPGFPFVRPIYVQMLGVPAGNPGYQPGSFTNVIEL